MFDLKQLKYFIVCAETGSISEAARLLYTTQPSVSKVVKALENEVGMELFYRLPRGIALSEKGQEFYRYACKIVNDMNVLEQMGKRNMTRWIRISLNPSSWFARQFVEFYNAYYEENYHFQIYTAGVRTVMERVRDYLDDIGFIYLMEQQKEEFLYELSRNRLLFTPMQEIESVFYPGKKNPLYNKKETSEITLEEMKKMRFIQNYQDDFFKPGENQSEASFSWNDLDVAVVTNSDYIMEKMLRKCNVANISGSYLSSSKEDSTPGIPLKFEKNKVVFGYITRKEEQLDEETGIFIEFLQKKLKSSPNGIAEV